jgi:phage baseplate assembly protein W
MADFGKDISATTGLDPAFTLVSGTTLVTQALFRRLTTPRGALFYAPDYGTDVREALLARLDRVRLDGWRTRIEAECKKDERVRTVRASLSFDPPAETLRIAIDGTTAAGPFRLVLAVSAVSVEVLKER